MTTPDFTTASRLELCRWFQEFFGAIPDEKWTTGRFHRDGKHCALGHCGVQSDSTRKGEWPEQAEALQQLFNDILLPNNGIGVINDGSDGRYPQLTPRARILAALADIQTKLEA